MNTNILNKLTYGFEIEGVFRNSLASKLKQGGRFVHDGSVDITTEMLVDMGIAHQQELQTIPRVTDCEDCIMNDDGSVADYCNAHHSNYRCEGQLAQEYASSVFSNFDEALQQLSLFKLPEYNWHYTGGLHIHIGIKNDDVKKLWSAASNIQFMKKLHGRALKWCTHQRERLLSTSRGDRYYKFWDNPDTLIDDTLSGKKYKFVRFHQTWNTIEFRFLSPCEHKEQNFKNLMEYLTQYLGNSFETTIKGEIETEQSSKLHEINLQIKPHAKGNVKYKLYKNDWPFYSEELVLDKGNWWDILEYPEHNKLSRGRKIKRTSGRNVTYTNQESIYEQDNRISVDIRLVQPFNSIVMPLLTIGESNNIHIYNGTICVDTISSINHPLPHLFDIGSYRNNTNIALGSLFYKFNKVYKFLGWINQYKAQFELVTVVDQLTNTTQNLAVAMPPAVSIIEDMYRIVNDRIFQDASSPIYINRGLLSSGGSGAAEQPGDSGTSRPF